MQVFGLPGHIIRSGKRSSPIAMQSPDDEAAIRPGCNSALARQAMTGVCRLIPLPGHPRRQAPHSQQSAGLGRAPHRIVKPQPISRAASSRLTP